MPAQAAFITINDAAEHLGCSTDTIRRMIARGDLRAVKLGRGVRAPIRIRPADLAKALRPVTPLSEEVAR